MTTTASFVPSAATKPFPCTAAASSVRTAATADPWVRESPEAQQRVNFLVPVVVSEIEMHHSAVV